MEQITPVLEKMAEKLGVTCEYLWSVLIKQAPLSGIADIVQYVLLGIATWVFVKVSFKVYRKIQENVWDEIAYIPLYIIGIGILIFWAVAFLCFPETIWAFFNPEYWALQQILQTIQ